MKALKFILKMAWRYIEVQLRKAFIIIFMVLLVLFVSALGRIL